MLYTPDNLASDNSGFHMIEIFFHTPKFPYYTIQLIPEFWIGNSTLPRYSVNFWLPECLKLSKYQTKIMQRPCSDSLGTESTIHCRFFINISLAGIHFVRNICWRGSLNLHFPCFNSVYSNWKSMMKTLLEVCLSLIIIVTIPTAFYFSKTAPPVFLNFHLIQISPYSWLFRISRVYSIFVS